jgi:hypothetical protein
MLLGNLGGARSFMTCQDKNRFQILLLMTTCTKLNLAGITISRFFKMIFPNEDTGIERFAEACTKRQDWQ